MTAKIGLLLVFVALAGCTTAASPVATLWAGLNSYHDEMTSLEARPERWPDRQRLAESIKMTYVATLGGSREFNRLVDLDLRRREFLIALRAGGLKADRAKEIREELVKINAQTDQLAAIVKEQLINTQIRAGDDKQLIESVATAGLLNLTMDRFLSANVGGDIGAQTTRVGAYIVSEAGAPITVRTPEGRIFRCSTILVPEAGASVTCEPASK